MRIRSRGARSRVAFDGTSSPFTKLRPDAPASPPRAPAGLCLRRSAAGLEHAELPDDAVAPWVESRAAGAEAQLVAFDP